MNTKKKVLVLGGGGALGQEIINLYRNNLNYECISAGLTIKNTVNCLLDIRNYDEVEKLIESISPDIVLNLTGTYTSEFEQSVAVNVQGSRNILEVCKKLLNKKRIRVVLMGSSAEYGLVDEADCPIKEDRLLRPITMNGVIKAWQTNIASYYYASGVDVIIARIFNLYGDGMSIKLFSGRVLSQIKEINAGVRKIIEVGDLNSVRDYISTNKAAELIGEIAIYGKSGEIYHVASGQAIIMRDFLMKCLIENGLDMSIVSEDKSLSNKVGHDIPIIYADMDKTRSII